MAKYLDRRFKACLYLIILLGISGSCKTDNKCHISDIDDKFSIKSTEENPGPPEDWSAHSGTSVEVICKSSKSFSWATCGERLWHYQDETCLQHTSIEKKFRRKKRFLGIFFRVIKCIFSRCSRPRPRDRTPPEIRNCPSDLYGEARPFQFYQFITWAEPTAWDGLDGQISVSRSGKRPGAPFFEGSTRVGYSARDRSGNMGSCHFYIHITVIRCPPLSPRISDGYRLCHLSFDMVKGTTCQYGCYQGHDLQGGPSYSECLPNGDWSINIEPFCEKKSCEMIPTFPKRTVSCSNQEYFRSICTFFCDDGYDVPDGVRRTKVCLASGVWNGENPTCEDIKNPSFETCPNTMLFYPTDNEDTATVYWDIPTVSDNNDNYMSPVQISGPSIGSNQEVGTYKVSYEAVDTAGNSATCSFNVVVKQLRCSRLYATPYLKMNCTGTRRGSSCSFFCDDNSSLNGVRLTYCQKVPDQPYSKWNMDHQPFCEVTDTCKELDPPHNGAMACDVWLGGRLCHPSCTEGYSVMAVSPLPEFVICNDDGVWLYSEKVTDCIEKATSRRRLADMSAEYYYSGDCQDPLVQETIKRNFITAIQTSVSWQSKCQSKCSVDNVRVKCGNMSRKKRSLSNLNVIITVYFESNTSIVSSDNYELEVNLLVELLEILRDDDFNIDVFSSMNNETVQLNSVSSSPLDTECPDNFIPDYGQTVGCVPCPPGKYYSSENKTCLYCHRGSYQPHYAQSVCLSCPSTQSTAREGATSPQECEDACGPGTFSSSGLPPCIDCDIGLYENSYGSVGCSKCPGNKITIKEGSTDVSNCYEFDLVFPPIHNDSYSVYEDPVPPLPLPFTMSMHTKIESAYGQIVALSSEEFNVTITSTDITVNGETGTFDNCLCMMTRWHMITLYVTENDTTLRLDDATVLMIPTAGPVSVDNFTIQLGGDGFAGSISQFMITGENVYGDKSANFQACSSEHYGDHIINWNDIAYSRLVNSYIEIPSKCDDFDDCQTQPCIHGNCTDELDAYSCSCLPGFSGKNCEVNGDDCSAHACQNNASCIDGIGKYSCLCEYGYTGDLCEVSMVDGNWADWDNWTDCSVSCGNGTRQRHRSCSDPLPDNGGQYCNGSDTEIEECVLDPCRECFALVATNHSTLTCMNIADMMTCTHTCDDGFWFDHDVKEEYKCGNETFNQWDFQTEDNPYARLPQCTEIVQATKIYVAHTAVYDKEDCDDSVKGLVEETVARELTNISSKQNGECVLESYEVLNCDDAKCQRRDLSTDNIGFKVNISCDIVKYGAEECYQLLADTIDEIETAGEAEKLNFLYTSKTYKIVTNTTTSDSVLDCPEGAIPYILYCVPCSIGHYYNTGECRDCQKGTYQDKTGRTYCYTCPEGSTTEGTASLSVDDCVVPVAIENDKKKWFVIGFALGVPLFLICVVVSILYCRHKTRGKQLDQAKVIPQRFDNVKKIHINVKRFSNPPLPSISDATEIEQVQILKSWDNPLCSLDDLDDGIEEIAL